MTSRRLSDYGVNNFFHPFKNNAHFIASFEVTSFAPYRTQLPRLPLIGHIMYPLSDTSIQPHFQAVKVA